LIPKKNSISANWRETGIKEFHSAKMMISQMESVTELAKTFT
jgi:hypothetical protein